MDEEWVEYDGGAVQEWHRNARRIRVAPDVTVIPEGAFERCGDLIVVDLRNVTTISYEAFFDCRSLERVVWSTPSSVEIGERAFASCAKLSEIDLTNVTKIGEMALLDCTSLKRVSIPSSVAAIEEGAFAGCKCLVGVELGEGIQSIGDGAFYSCSGLVRINIPSSLKDIVDNAFFGCGSLVEVVLNEGLRQIGEGAFQYCKSLQSIDIPSSVLKVGDHAFFGCDRLQSVELQEGLQAIESWAFRRCRSLERITIPSSVTFVGEQAFEDCDCLAEVTLREGVHCIDNGAFVGCASLEHINIPPFAFVINIEGSNCQLMRSTMPNPRARTLVVSKWMQYRSQSQLEQAEAKVNEILRCPEQSESMKILSIRELFAYYDLVDVTSILELAIWRATMDGNEQDAEARQDRRRNCGNDMNVIIKGVLSFLEV